MKSSSRWYVPEDRELEKSWLMRWRGWLEHRSWRKRSRWHPSLWGRHHGQNFIDLGHMVVPFHCILRWSKALCCLQASMTLRWSSSSLASLSQPCTLGCFDGYVVFAFNCGFYNSKSQLDLLQAPPPWWFLCFLYCVFSISCGFAKSPLPFSLLPLIMVILQPSGCLLCYELWYWVFQVNFTLQSCIAFWVHESIIN
jgi:hypothetical protein